MEKTTWGRRGRARWVLYVAVWQVVRVGEVGACGADYLRQEGAGQAGGWVLFVKQAAGGGQ
jgi:hypothetical protein